MNVLPHIHVIERLKVKVWRLDTLGRLSFQGRSLGTLSLGEERKKRS